MQINLIVVVVDVVVVDIVLGSPFPNHHVNLFIGCHEKVRLETFTAPKVFAIGAVLMTNHNMFYSFCSSINQF